MSDGTPNTPAPTPAPSIAGGSQGDPAGTGGAGAAPVPAASPAGSPPAAAATPPAPANTQAPADEGKGEEPALPEKYEFKLPENTTLDPEIGSKLEEFARGAKLTQEQAQGALELGFEYGQKIVNDYVNRGRELVTGWTSEAMKDPEIGGANMAAAKPVIALALDTFFPKEFRKILDETGVGNNVHLLKGLHQIGMKLSESPFLNNGSRGEPQRDPATVLYGGSK